MLADARLPLLRMLEEEDDPEIFSALIWSLSQIGGEDVRTYLENLIDQTEDDDVVEFIEDALANLAFTEDLERFDIFALNPDEDLLELGGSLDEDDEEERPAPKKPAKGGKKKK